MLRLFIRERFESLQLHLQIYGRDAGRTLDYDGEFSDCWGIKDTPQRYFFLEGFSDPGDDLRGQQRVPAQIKEVVVHAQFFELEQTCPDLSQFNLNESLRSD